VVDLAMVLDDEELRRRFGAATLERGRDYADRGLVVEHVSQRDADGDLDVQGVVSGSTRLPYVVILSVGVDHQGPWVASQCTCPVRADCKHAVALLLTVRAEHRRDGGAAGPGRWERQLSTLLDELEGTDARTTTARPLALLIDLRRPISTRWAQDTPTRGTLRMRPVQRGSRDNWIKTGASWSEVPYLDVHGGYPPAQVAVLTELLVAYRAANRQAYYGAETHLDLASFDATLWRLFERATQAGVELVAGDGLTAVHVHTDTLAMEIDVNGEREAHLRLGVRLGDDWYGADGLDVLGRSGHGVALWRPTDHRGHRAVTLAALVRPVGPQTRRLLRADDSIRVPAEDREGLVSDYLPRVNRHLPVTSSDGSVTVAEPVLPRLVATVTWKAVDEVSLAWSWRYQVGDDDRVYGLDETRGLRGLRLPAHERALLDALELTDLQAHVLCHGARRERGLVERRTFSHGQAVAFAEDVLPGLPASSVVEVEEIGARPDYRQATEAPVVRFEARDQDPSEPQRTDWLDLEVVISVDGQFLALAHLLEALTLGQDRVVIGDGVHVAVDRPEFKQLAELVHAAGELQEQPDDGIRVGHHDLGLWGELADAGIVDAQAQQWVRAARALQRLDTLPQVEPTGVTADLRTYQLDGFRWLAFLWQAGLGGILADDMGLGKTMQTLALVAHAREHGAQPFLVVAPTSVVSIWAHEARAFAPGLVVRTVTESHARRGTTIAQLADGADLVVTSYTLYRLEVDSYIAQRWSGLVIDEAQMVKNHRGKTYQSVRRLDVPFRLALTGTPMENRLMELWSLLSIVAPGLYPWPQRFTDLVANPVERLGDRDALDRFRRRIRPFLLRRTKELVAPDLPPKQEQVLEVTLTPRHRRVYETHLQRERQTVLGLVGDFQKNRIAIFSSLTRLRQLSLDAGLVDEQYDGIGSAKVDVLVDHLAELTAEGHRALVFSQFTSFLHRVRERLDREGIATAYLDGRTRDRATVIDGFKQGDAPVFLISLKAGGVGLTLTEADYCFVLDPWWNPAVEAQAVDRAHRIGQTRPVVVYRLVSADTIEEKVMALKARKAALFAQVVDDDALMSVPLGVDDVRALIED